jgi:hypothetical protein
MAKNITTKHDNTLIVSDIATIVEGGCSGSGDTWRHLAITLHPSQAEKKFFEAI